MTSRNERRDERPETMPDLAARKAQRSAAREKFGGKGAALFELSDAGFPVPPFESAADDSDVLAEQVARLGFPLVVRSSATAEDGERASFAGQFTSFLNLHSLEEVRDAVAACHASLHSEGLRQYCSRHEIDLRSLRMRPLLQRMIQPEIAGVAFSIHPTTGADEVVIEACEGLADDLLAGRVSPMPLDHPRLATHLPNIRALARAVQRHFGSPQDIEFAIDATGLHLLQARPVTRLQFDSDIGEWTNADFRDGGVSSSVCSPLMWSLYETIWNDSLKRCLRELRMWDRDFEAGRMFFGRPYWNLGAVKQAVSRIPGFVERDFDQDLSVQPTYDGDGLCTPTNLRTILRAIPIIAALLGFFRRRQADAESLLKSFPTIESRCEQASLDRVDAFRELIERDFRHVEGTYFRTIYAVSLAKLDWQESFPDCDYAALVAALPPLRHMAPVRKLRAMQLQNEVDPAALAREFRHHSRWGIDVRHPRWDEEVEFVAEWANNYSPSETSDPRGAFEQSYLEAEARISWWRRPSWRRKLARLRHFVWLREELRDLSSRMYYWIRRHVVELGRQREVGDDIFFQTYSEVYTDQREHIVERRDIFERFRNFAAPNEIGGRFHFDSTRLPGDLHGIGAGGGRAQGVAHVAQDVNQALTSRPGSILVCPFTEPGWTPALERAAGVVTETGGQLSHAAVICREFGIPAVLGVQQATQRIRPGSSVEVDGARGEVRLLPSISPEY